MRSTVAGSTVLNQFSDDGNGSVTISDTRQEMAAINGSARVVESFSRSFPSSADGSVSYQASYNKTGYTRVGRVIADPARTFAKSASWSVDTEGNVTTSGVIDADGYVDIDATTENLQTFVVLNGQAKISHARSVSLTENIDGSTVRQVLDVDTHYVTVHNPPVPGQYLGRLRDNTPAEGPEGTGTWEA